MTDRTSLVAGRLRALAHPIRLGIMRELAETPETCACDFTDLFTVAQPTISAHLRILREAGLVTTRRRGNQICYSIDREALDQTLAELHELRLGPRPGPGSEVGRAEQGRDDPGRHPRRNRFAHGKP